MNINACLSHNSDEWTTPKDFYKLLDQEFHFTVDLCTNGQNNLCNKYYTRDTISNCTECKNEIIFCNPPYSKLKDFIILCDALSESNLVVMLIPARTDTKAFHEYIYKKHEIRFIKGRIKFGNGKNSAPFPSMLVIMRKKKYGI